MTSQSGIVTIGIAKPLPCSTVVGGDKANGPSVQSSQECINSLASDEHTGMDSFHECLQEYGEGLEVVQICLEPEEASIKDDELSALGDFSFDDYKKIKKEIIIDDTNEIKVNGISEMKSSKSDESLDDHDDDMTITEDDILVAPRELTNSRSKSVDRRDEDREKCLSKQQSKEISTSDEMVFAVTPTGLERISFDKYWKENGVKIEKQLEKVKSDESWKECLNSPVEDTISFYDATTRISVQDENNALLYIDHEIDGYETCLDEDSSSQKFTVKNARKMNGDTDIKEFSKHEKIDSKNKNNDVSAKIVNVETSNQTVSDDVSYSHPYVQEHIIKQMKSLRIEPLNVNVYTKKKKRSPTKPSKLDSPRIQCVEYYNDQAECLKEIRQKKLEEEEKKHKEEQKKRLKTNLAAMEKRIQMKQQASEESTDAETTYDPSCHKCFLENYAYVITQAYMAEANACKYCEVIREMLEVPKDSSRRGSAPALVNLDSGCSETDDEDLLMVPVVKDRRKSAGPLKFPASSRRPSFVPLPTMTVTVSSDRRTETLVAQRWGPPRQVTLKRCPGAPLGVSIVGGKVDIISHDEDEDGEEKAIFGIFIKNVVPESPAGNSGQLQTGDRILEVDGTCVRSAQHERAVQLIKAAGDTVTLTVQSLFAWNTDSSDVEATTPPVTPKPSARKSPAPSILDKTPTHEIKITVTSEADVEKDAEEAADEQDNKEANSVEKKPVYSDSESSDEEDERELQGRTYSDKGVEIDRASAGAVKRSKEEKEADPEEEDDFGYTTSEWKDTLFTLFNFSIYLFHVYFYACLVEHEP
ncbi:unnamed protein product [Arctia plantaginis]|uniref:PDZ domain-containing protein n=1 Tax=Arctia plantaginis TaxID=874455 RepID=A0A8S0ZYS1_ARCPL|nr:unnamed protein product [Arctia plantaginis]